VHTYMQGRSHRGGTGGTAPSRNACAPSPVDHKPKFKVQHWCRCLFL